QAFFVVAKPSVDIETIFNRLTGKLRLAVEKPLEMIPLPARQDVHCASGAARIEVSRKEKFVVDRQFAIYELAGPDYKVAMLIIGTGADIAAVQAEIDLLSTSLKILDKSAPPGPNPHKHP
ncbi:hypothetical protein JW905_19470, partial [bacterium]|nr:hypothetical protein [candidate division CSSED10-310 bacterium]